jgi:hypothetical protein
MGDVIKPPLGRHAQVERPRPRPRTEVEKDLRHLADAREAGLVTEEEFRERRLHLLGRRL